METSSAPRARRRARLVRTLGWIAVAGMLGLALIGPGAGGVSANDLHQTPPIAPPYSGVNQDCSGPFAGMPDGQMGWHFVQTSVPDEITSGNLSVTFSPGGSQVVPSWTKTGGTLHWYVWTAAGATLTAASSDVTSTGNLNLSHICGGTTTTTTSSSSTSTTDTSTTDTSTTDTSTTDTSTTDTSTTDTTSTATSSTDTTSTASTDTTSTSSTATTATSSTQTTQSSSTSSTSTSRTTTTFTDDTTTTFTTPQTTTQTTATLATTTTPTTTTPATTTTQSSVTTPATTSEDTGGVAGVTSDPNTTPPPTSTGGTPGTPGDGTWRIALLAMAGLLAAILVMTPATSRRRR